MLAGSPGFASIADPVAGDRHRRQLRHLQLRRRAAAAAAARSSARASVFTVGSTATLEALGASCLVSSYRDYVDIRDRSKSFEGLAALTRLTVRVRERRARRRPAQDGHARQRQPLRVDGRRARSSAARSRPEEDQVPGPRRGRRPRAARCGSRSSDRTRRCSAARIRLDGIEFTVIGVAPPEFSGLDPYVRSDFFVPLMMSPRIVDRSEDRVAPGARRAQPRAEGPPRSPASRRRRRRRS